MDVEEVKIIFKVANRITAEKALREAVNKLYEVPEEELRDKTFIYKYFNDPNSQNLQRL